MIHTDEDDEFETVPVARTRAPPARSRCAPYHPLPSTPQQLLPRPPAAAGPPFLPAPAPPSALGNDDRICVSSAATLCTVMRTPPYIQNLTCAASGCPLLAAPRESRVCVLTSPALFN